MKMSPYIVTLEAIATKTGVASYRFPLIRKVYEDNRHNPTLLQNQLQSLLLSEAEVTSIMAYIGAVIVGQAIDDKLYLSEFPD